MGSKAPRAWQTAPGWLKAAAVVALVGAAGIGLAASRSGRGAPAAPADPGAAAPVPVPAPEALLCDLYVPAPNAAWTRLQRGIGGAVGILPATLPGVIVALADLDVTLGGELDGSAPMYGVAAGDPGDPAFLLAIKLVDPRRARVVLADADAGRFTSKPAEGMTLLVPLRGGGRALATAISDGGYFLVARTAADLGRLGPYATRTLPSRPLPLEAAVTVDVPRTALSGLLRPKLEAWWKEARSYLVAQDERMRSERGRAPDFGDPAAIVAALDAVLGRRVAIVGDLERVRIGLEVLDDAAVLDATLVPAAGDGPAHRWIDAMRVGDAAPVLALPAVSAVALSTRDSEADRAAQGVELERAITTALGPRLKDPAKVHEVIETSTRARDEVFAVAFALEDPGGGFLRAHVRDADAASRALRGVFDLARAAPFKELLRAEDVSAATEELPGLGKVDVVSIARATKRAPRDAAPRAAADAGAPRPGGGKAHEAGFGAAWVVEGGVLELGAGSEPVVSLKIGARPARRLDGEPSLKRFVTAIGSEASTVIVGQPLRLDPRRAGLPFAAVGLATGKRGANAFVRVDVPDALLREAARSQMGF